MLTAKGFSETETGVNNFGSCDAAFFCSKCLKINVDSKNANKL